jgi:23S rRNA-/tRNA-specific pseudouridylate synthase
MINAVESLGNKQALHANSLGFEHPATKEILVFQLDPPKEMLNVIKLI